MTEHISLSVVAGDAAPMLTCRLCGGAGEPVPLGGIRCGECGSISACRLPDRAELDEYYRAFNRDYSGGGRNAGRGGRQRRYSEKYLQLVRKFAGGKYLVDVGSSTNPFPNRAKDAGYEVTVVDYVRPAALSEGIAFVQGSLDDPGDLAMKIGPVFDVVTAFAVIEHCRYPRKAAEALSKLCRSKGVIILTTPETGTFADKFAMGRSAWFYPPEHLNLISRKALALTFGLAGCRLIHSARFELNPLRWLARYGLGLAEGIAGWVLRGTAPSYWERLRSGRVSLNQGIALYVMEKSGC